ncbi:MAG TPA: hypothetical protein PKH24_16045 [Sedimentisphaerales bacterium]|nr:hypothetical protein [Sedimentisphaerales bacterium]HNU31771.1 hypothetical protein [Sedimentisphaerales bacterium]
MTICFDSQGAGRDDKMLLAAIDHLCDLETRTGGPEHRLSRIERGKD